MPRKKTGATRGRIISSAWKLFYEQGYEETTIEDILEASGTSRGTFYHYFSGKDALLGTLAYVFDEKYEELKDRIPKELDAVGQLQFLNHELFGMVERSISRDLLARLLSTQLLASGERHLLDRNRTYFRMLRSICERGEAAHVFREDMDSRAVTKAYALWERALLYDWCLCEGDYSLLAYTDQMTPVFLAGLRRRDRKSVV